MKTVKQMISMLALSVLVSANAMAAGAIVVDDEEGPAQTAWFVSVKHGADELAARDALAQCRAEGNRSCLVAVRFAEQCAALADSSRFYRVGRGATIAQASENALRECPGCRVVQTACDSSQVAMNRN
jgi:hypothetical protein